MTMILLSSPNIVWIVLAIITIFALITFVSYYFSTKQVVLRRLSKIPLKSGRSLKTNEFSKVSGKALHVKSPLLAPLSGRKCVFYTITIKKRVSTGNSTRWKTIVKEEKSQEFFINNHGDFVIVRPISKNYISYLVKDKKIDSGAFKNPTPEFESLLRRYDIEPKNILGFNKSLRYREGVIEIGEQITVAGIAKWKTLNEPIPDYPYSKIAELVCEGKQKLLITDLLLEANKKDRF